MTGPIRHTLQETQEESSTFNLDRSDTELGHVVQTAVSVNQAAAIEKDITLSVAIAGEVWTNVDGDLILETVDNLISNAIKYSNSGTETVITTTATPSQSIISVRDQGQGFTDQDLKPFRG